MYGQHDSFLIDGKRYTQETLIRAFALVVTKHLSLILRRGALPAYVDRDDLLQEGRIALLEAASRYNKKRGAKFPTFASKRVHGAMMDHLRMLEFSPRTVFQRGKKVERIEEALMLKLGRKPTETEVAAELGWSTGDLAYARQRMASSGILSIDGPDFQRTGRNAAALRSAPPTISESLSQIGASVTAPFEAIELNAAIEEALLKERLDWQEKQVFILFHIDRLSIKDIAERMGVSDTRISQLRAKVDRKMRVFLREQGFAPGPEPHAVTG